MRPFRFLAEPSGIIDGKTLAERARRAEAIGIDTLVKSDHLLDLLAPIPALATIAAATDRLRISAFVFNNDLRHPAVLAQDLATLDVLSGGRIDIGLGAGWNEPEYKAIGLPFDPVGVRVSRMEESIAVLKGLLGDGSFSFHGMHYAITEMDGQPKPIQRPHPPFFIGGGGRRILSIAGREADIVSLAPRLLSGQRGDPLSITWAGTEEKIGWVREAAGQRFGDLEFNVYPTQWPIVVTNDLRGEARKVIDKMKSRTGVELSEDEVIAAPNIFIGSVDRFVEKFQELRERLGISSFMVGEIDELAPVVERLAGT